ncbi:hypothetical protein WICMUC_000489 [Wickerhamomyces mucosus]|uniref:Protein Zds1 C-terminal domain-containing protein n=1 Tax=Wickerhamomyces mucosus TaxID=1378264 RepID=A0A9P8TIN5_9ASCO|nr:hypothetical protein WICMUC_000489 [Wickerhamomyces mucosus]
MSNSIIDQVEIEDRHSKIAINELNDQKQIKRKSNAHLAAEVVQQERDAIRALKRLSMGGGSSNIDPEFEINFDNEFNENELQKKHKRRSSSSLSSGSDDFEQNLINFSNNKENEDLKQLDTEKLLWVPAKSHPSISPDKFRRHVQLTLDNFNESNNNDDHNNDNSNSSSNSNTTKKENTNNQSKNSIPSLKELTDELDRLSELAGLAATDAITLARSLSSTSISFNKDQSSTEINQDSSKNLFQEDEDSPIFDNNSLKRNKFSTYSRSTRMSKNKLKIKPLNNLEIKNDIFQDSSNNDDNQRKQQQQQNSNQENRLNSFESRGRLEEKLLDSPQQTKRTNHSRNRHAGSTLSLDYNTQDKKSQFFSEENSMTILDEKTHDNEVPLTSSSTTEEHLQPKSQHEFPKTFDKLKESNSLNDLNGEFEEDFNSKDLKNDLHEELEKDSPVKEKSRSKVLNLFRKKRISTNKDSVSRRSVSLDDSFSSKEYSKSSSPPSSASSISSSSSSSLPQRSDSPLPTKQRSSSHQYQKQQQQQQRPVLKPSNFKFSKKKEEPIPPAPTPSSRQISQSHATQSSLKQFQQQSQQPQQHQQASPNEFGLAMNTEQHRLQKESLTKKLSIENLKKSNKPNAPVQFTDSAFGFPLPPLSNSTIIMLDFRFPIHVERALYRLSHLKLANPKRPLRQQVLLSNFMYAYLNLVNHTLYLQSLDEESNSQGKIQTQSDSSQ